MSIIGGDLRTIKLAVMLAKEQNQVYVYGLEKAEELKNIKNIEKNNVLTESTAIAFEGLFTKYLFEKDVIDNFEYVKNIPARAFASEIIKKLHDEGNKIIIITGRYKTQEDSSIGEQMRKDTVNWLNKNIIYDEICYAHCPKTKEIKEKNIDIMIEDSPAILPEIVKITKVLCFDNRYNRDLIYNNMTRVFSWYDIYRKIKQV